MFDFLKFWKDKEPLIGPQVSFTFDNTNQMVNINVSWPKDYPQSILQNQFAKMLLQLQTGAYHKTIMEAVIKKSMMINNEAIGSEIVNNIHKISNESLNDEDQVSMWPSNVFGNNNQGNQQ